MINREKFLKALAAVLAFGAVAGFLVWRAPFGYADLDECFPVTVAYRLHLGDALIVDERFGAQLSHLVIYPFFLLYHSIVGSMTGILLASRLFFAAAVLAAAIFHFAVWRRTSFTGALLGAVAFAIFAPFSIMLFTYYSIEVVSCSLILSLLLAKPFQRDVRHALVGFFLALAVMANPYLVLAYPVYSVYELLLGKSLRRWIAITAGCAALGLPVLAFIFLRAPASDVFASVKYLFDDPGHPSETLVQMLQTWWKAMINQQGQWTPYLMAFAGILPGVLAVSFPKFFEPRRLLLHAWSALTGLLWVYLATFKSVLAFPDYPMTPLAFIALGFALTSGKRDIRVGAVLAFAATLLVDFASCCASNQDRIRVATCMAILSPMAMTWMWAVAAEQTANRPRSAVASRIFAALFCLSAICAITYLRYDVVFWEPRMSNPNQRLDATIPDGAHKGIVTTKFKFEKKHRRIQSDVLKAVELCGTRKLLCTAGDPLCYIFAEREISGYSAWMAENDPNTFEKLETYYAMRPHKIPDTIIFTRHNPKLEKAFLAAGYKNAGRYLNFPVLMRHE